MTYQEDIHTLQQRLFHQWQILQKTSSLFARDRPTYFDKILMAGQFVVVTSGDRYSKVEEIAFDPDTLRKYSETNSRNLVLEVRKDFELLRQTRDTFEKLQKDTAACNNMPAFIETRHPIKGLANFATFRQQVCHLRTVCTSIAYHCNVWTVHDVRILLKEGVSTRNSVIAKVKTLARESQQNRTQKNNRTEEEYKNKARFE